MATSAARYGARNALALALLGGHLQSWINSYGYEAVFVLVALESLGLPLPGETALITAALYAATTHHLNIAIIVAVAAAAAIIGDNVGFALGRWGGYRILRRYGRYIRFDQRRIKIGLYVFREHGGKVVFFGRFIPVLRTYAAFLAGTNRMSWPRFLVFNAGGGITWALVVGLAYYYIGAAVSHVRGPLDIILGAVAVVVVVGFLIYLHRAEDRYAARAEEAFPGELPES
jgi:membrane protein DedA with SNARE-associated domain